MQKVTLYQYNDAKKNVHSPQHQFLSQFVMHALQKAVDVDHGQGLEHRLKWVQKTRFGASLKIESEATVDVLLNSSDSIIRLLLNRNKFALKRKQR